MEENSRHKSCMHCSRAVLRIRTSCCETDWRLRLQGHGRILLTVARWSSPNLGGSSQPIPCPPTPQDTSSKSGSFKAWANCAIDALAVPRMLGRSGRILSECAHCGAAITIEVAGETVLGTPASIVVGYGGLADCCDRPAIEARCPYINFFCNIEHADLWLRPGSWAGEFLPLPRAAAVAADRFHSIIDAYRSVFSPESSLPE